MIGANTSKTETNVTMTGMMMGTCKIQSTKLLVYSLAVLTEVGYTREGYFHCLIQFFLLKFLVLDGAIERVARIWIGKTLLLNH